MKEQGKKPIISMIVAVGKNRAIGRKGQLLWSVPEDLKRFREKTLGHPVIMGRKTWESLPEKYRPLPARKNIVITRQNNYQATGAEVSGSLEEAIRTAKEEEGGEIFVIGGQQIYEQALPFTDRLYITVIDSEKNGDAFFPEYEHIFKQVLEREERDYKGLKYLWLILER